MKSDGRLVIIERNTHKERAHPPSFMTNREILEVIKKADFTLAILFKMKSY